MNDLGPFLLAAAFEQEVQRATTEKMFGGRELMIGLTIALGLGFAIVLWVYLRSRKKSREQDRQRIRQMTGGQSNPKAGSPVVSVETGPDGRQRRRKRRRRRDHRPRNPPLSQTGGLPPPRPDDQLPKY